jgi:hypothetical protein
MTAGASAGLPDGEVTRHRQDRRAAAFDPRHPLHHFPVVHHLGSADLEDAARFVRDRVFAAVRVARLTN